MSRQAGRPHTRHRGDEAEAVAVPQGDADGDAANTWKQEMDTIMSGTHPLLVAELKKPTQTRDTLIAQADRIRQLQTANVNALFECDKKQIEDEYVAQLQFFQQRLIDSIERKQQKSARRGGLGGRRGANGGSKKQKSIALGTDATYSLKPDELKGDVDEILRNVDHYSVRASAMASDDMRSTGNGDAYFDRTQQVLHLNNHVFERGSSVYVHNQGQRVDGQWTVTAMNTVEVTLRDRDGTKLKVSLSQLRNSRYVLRPA